MCMQRGGGGRSREEERGRTSHMRTRTLICRPMNVLPYLGQYWEVELPPWRDVLLREEEGGVSCGEGILTI